jgi:PKD repeat protein
MSGFVGSKEASLHLTPKGGGGVGSSNPSSSLDGSPKAPVKPKAIGNGSDWMPPNEGSSELIDPSLAAFPEKGFAPLDVRFDASKSSAVNGIVLYNFDLIWGPDDDPDDGYYEKSGSDPYWTRRIAEPGLYKAVVDVEDGKGNRARAAKAIWITYSEKNLGVRIEANVTEGPLPLTVRFRAVPQAVVKEDAAVYAYWDFDTRDIGEMVGGDIAVYGTVVHTFERYGSHRVGVSLMDKDRNAGNMSTIDIMAYYGGMNEAPKG